MRRTITFLMIMAAGFAQASVAGETADTFPAEPVYQPIAAPLASDQNTQGVVRIGKITDTLRRDYQLDPYYKKAAGIHGIVIVGSEKVSDYAFLECAWTLDHLLAGRTMALDALVKAKVRVGIIAVTEYTMDIPENRAMGNGAFNDRRSRGLGGLPLATCAEENLLNLRGDPYTGENITIHEFSHTVASAVRQTDPDWYQRLRESYKRAMAGGLYGKSYAATNEQEYWAEGAQAWFDAADPRNSGGNATREQLKAYDPPLAALLIEVYGDGPWRYSKTNSDKRQAPDLAHLKGFNRDAMPVFDFKNSPRIRAATSRPAE